MISLQTFAKHVHDYVNTAECNDAVFTHFTEQTWAQPTLARHRRHIEEHKLGFGDPAFHFMWFLLLQAAAERFPRVRCVEIGVFKGQVISLWSLLARDLALPLEITAVTPLQGNPLRASRLLRSIRYRLDRKFREQVNNGNFYPDDDYERTIQNLFTAFALDFNRVRIVRGFSNASATLETLRDDHFEIVYVDGDHTYEGVLADLENYSPKITTGGWIIVDDASFFFARPNLLERPRSRLACLRPPELARLHQRDQRRP